MAPKQETLFVLQAMESAYKERSPERELIFHSDQGGQYTSAWFRREAKCRNMKSSFSRAGCPFDNAVVESFFGSFKREEINHHYFRTADDLYAAVDEYVEFYNSFRPHKSLRMLTPNQKEEIYYNSLKSR